MVPVSVGTESSTSGPEAGRPAPAAERTPSLFTAVRSTALMTLASRCFGLVRDVLIGRIFGDTALNSNFQAAFAIPNMFRRLFGEGALSAAFGSLVLLAWWRPATRWTGAAPAGAWVMACLLLSGNLTAGLLPVRAVLLAAAPFAAAVALIPMLRGRPWIATLLAVIGAAAIAGTALGLAARSYEPAG